MVVVIADWTIPTEKDDLRTRELEKHLKARQRLLRCVQSTQKHIDVVNMAHPWPKDELCDAKQNRNVFFMYALATEHADMSVKVQELQMRAQYMQGLVEFAQRTLDKCEARLEQASAFSMLSNRSDACCSFAEWPSGKR